MTADGHAPSVVGDLNRAVRENSNLDVARVACHGLVDRVVDDFPDEVVQPAGVGRADVHARASPNRIQAFEDLDAGCVVLVGRRLLGPAAFGFLRFGRRLFGAAARELLGQAFPPVRRSNSRANSSSL